MSIAQDLWMTPAKRRLLRRSMGNGPNAMPPGTEAASAVAAGTPTPGASKLNVTVTTPPTALTVSQLVVLIPRQGTGSAAAFQAVNQLRCVVNTVASPVVTLSTAPTDLSASGIDFTGLVVDVVPLS